MNGNSRSRNLETGGVSPKAISPLSIYTRVDDLQGKDVVDVDTGEKLGTLADIAVDTRSIRTVALIMSLNPSSRQDTLAVPVEQVQAWGEDVIMVNHAGQVHRADNRPGMRDRWVNALGQVVSLPVISADGTRIGEVEDVLLGANGSLVGLTLGPAGLPSALVRPTGAPASFIDAASIQALGPDVVLLMPNTFHAAQTPDEGFHAINPNDAVDNRTVHAADRGDREDPCESGGVRHNPAPDKPVR